MKSCPYCAEKIQDDAIKCRFCGEWLGERPEAEPEEDLASKAAAVEGIEVEDPADAAEGPEGDWEQYALDYKRKSRKERREAWESMSSEQREALLAAWEALGYEREAAIPAKKSGSKAGRIVAAAFIAFVVVTVLLLAASQSDQTSPRSTSSTPRPSASERDDTPAERTTPTGWRTVKRWSGSGIKETESFDVASREWRIHWETQNETFGGAGIFQIYVHRASDDALIELVANKQGTGSDVSYVRAAPGRYYLDINSANIDWSVRVEDQR